MAAISSVNALVQSPAALAGRTRPSRPAAVPPAMNWRLEFIDSLVSLARISTENGGEGLADRRAIGLCLRLKGRPSMRHAARALIAATAMLLPALAQAQPTSWPTRPVTMVVPFAAGGPMDVVGRIMAASLSEQLGQQVIIENVGGGGGMTGAARVAKAQPDGSQFVLGNVGTHAVSQSLFKN